MKIDHFPGSVVHFSGGIMDHFPDENGPIFRMKIDHFPGSVVHFSGGIMDHFSGGIMDHFPVE